MKYIQEYLNNNFNDFVQFLVEEKGFTLGAACLLAEGEMDELVIYLREEEDYDTINNEIG